MAEQRTSTTDIAVVPGCHVRELPAPAVLASVIARRGAAAAVAALIEGATLNWPTGTAFLPMGPGHWLAIAEEAGTNPATAGEAFERSLAGYFAGSASVCDQTGSRVRFAVAGARARELLSRGVSLDLHPTRFAVGQVAVTTVGHIGVLLRQVDAAPTYQLLVARSYAGSLRHWLQSTAGGLGAA